MIDEKLCELRHSQMEKDLEGVKDYVRVLHESDERFLSREVMQITKELKKLEDHEKRLRVQERWRYILMGAWGLVMLVVPLLLKFFGG